MAIIRIGEEYLEVPDTEEPKAEEPVVVEAPKPAPKPGGKPTPVMKDL